MGPLGYPGHNPNRDEIMLKKGKNSKYVIHVGLPKTATKFLQRRFFPSLENIFYCDTKTTHKKFADYFHLAGDLEFNASYASELFHENTKFESSNRTFLFSQEGLYGNPWYGGALMKRNADRIAAIFENPHIVIVLRNQPDLLQSLYQHYIKSGGTETWKSFLGSEQYPLIISPDFFKYGNYIQYLIDVFGKDHVWVLFYEDCKTDLAEYLNQFCDIIGLKRDSWDKSLLNCRENPSLSPFLLAAMRFANKLTSTSKHPHLLLPRNFHGAAKKVMMGLSAKLSRSDRPAIPKKAADEFLKDCHESNRLLEKIVGRDLGPLGYPGV
jgi:hypothetical protein